MPMSLCVQDPTTQTLVTTQNTPSLSPQATVAGQAATKSRTHLAPTQRTPLCMPAPLVHSHPPLAVRMSHTDRFLASPSANNPHANTTTAGQADSPQQDVACKRDGDTCGSGEYGGVSVLHLRVQPHSRDMAGTSVQPQFTCPRATCAQAL